MNTTVGEMLKEIQSKIDSGEWQLTDDICWAYITAKQIKAMGSEYGADISDADAAEVMEQLEEDLSSETVDWRISDVIEAVG